MGHFLGGWYRNPETIRKSLFIAVGLIMIAILVWYFPDPEFSWLW